MCKEYTVSPGLRSLMGTRPSGVHTVVSPAMHCRAHSLMSKLYSPRILRCHALC